MVQKNIRFMTTGQLMTFCNVCQKMNADITVKDVTGRFEIDAKSIVGLMTIRMGEKMHLLIEGEEEHLADSYFEKFDCTPVTIPVQLKAALDMPEIYGTRSRKMEVTYDYYRIFYYAAKYKSFSQAATILMSNQPNVTRAIHNLESQLGCRLFIRSNRGAELTPEGERLYSHVAIAYDHLHAAELELENEKKLEQGTVTIGVSEIALHLLLLPVLGEFRRKYPKIRLRISSYTAPQAIQTVRNGLSDFAVASTPAEVKKPLKAIPLLSFKEILVANAAYKDMFKEPVSLKKLVEYPFICLGKNTSTYDFYTRFFLEHGIAMTADTEAATIDQILPMVRQNLGIGFIPEPLAQEVIEQGIVIQVPLLEEPPVREICFVEDKSSPHSMAANVLKEMLFQAGEKE